MMSTNISGDLELRDRLLRSSYSLKVDRKSKIERDRMVADMLSPFSLFTDRPTPHCNKFSRKCGNEHDRMAAKIHIDEFSGVVE